MKLSFAAKITLLAFIVDAAGMAGLGLIIFRDSAQLLRNESLDDLSSRLDRETAILAELLKKAREDALFLADSLERQVGDRTRELHERETRYQLLTETTGSIIIVVAPGGAILEFNPAAEQLLGVPREEAMGSNYFQTFLSEGNCQTAFEVSRRMLAGQASINVENELITAEGNTLYFRLNVARLLDDHGKLAGLVITGQDITERKVAEEAIKSSLEEKEVLLAEIHHRVKSNLQVVSSMLSLQGNAHGDERVAAALADSERRVKVMAQVHENLYRSQDLGYIDGCEYLHSIIHDTQLASGNPAQSIKILEELEELNFDIDTAISLGQITSELLSNSLKHAFPN